MNDQSQQSARHRRWGLIGLSLTAPFLAAQLARTLTKAGYRTVTNEHPPRNPAAASVSWKDALIWSAAVGATAGIARLATRRALTGWLEPQHNNDLNATDQAIIADELGLEEI